MKKTLTEKWKDMDLADDHLYYWRMPNGEVRIMTKIGVYSYKLCYDGGDIDILAPVPSYDEYQCLLSDQLAKNEAIEINAELEHKIERLQEQLNETNEVIQGYSKLESLMNCAFGKREKGPAQKYLEKWGVK